MAHFNSFFNNYLFFKFINKCQKEILRCAPPSSHVSDFLLFLIHHSRVPNRFHKFSTSPNYMDPVYLALEIMCLADSRINFPYFFSNLNIYRILGLTRLKLNFFDIFHLIPCFQHLLLFPGFSRFCHIYSNMVSRLQSHWFQTYRATTRRQFLQLIPQEFLLFIWFASKG